MKKDKPQSSFVNIGSSSLLIIFLVLSLVTFAVLSLSGAKHDYTFSQTFAAHKTAYYEASNTAEEILGQIDDTLAACATTGSYLSEAEKAFDQTQINGILLHFESGCILFSVPMSEGQDLQVKIELTEDPKASAYYIIKAWQVVSTNQWEGDQSIQLLPMED